MRYKQEREQLAKKIKDEFDTMQTPANQDSTKEKKSAAITRDFRFLSSGMDTYKPRSSSAERRERGKDTNRVHPDQLQLTDMIGLNPYTDRQTRVNRYMGELERRAKLVTEKEEEKRKINANE